MKKSNTHLIPRIITLSFSALILPGMVLPALTVLLYTPSAYTENYDPSASVFRFHQKMAKRGVAASQQKLGLMYETGSGTRQSTVNARLWYKRAAAQNYKPAINRLTYLQIKQSGYTDEHRKWLKNLKSDASFNNGEALFLLGQMYSEGTGVNKNLTRSLELLQKAAAGDIPGSEAQVAKIEEELSALQKQHARQKRVVRPTPATTGSATKPRVNKTGKANLKPAKIAHAKTLSTKPVAVAASVAISHSTVPTTPYRAPAKPSQTAQQKTSAKSRNKQDESTNKTSTTATKKTASHKTLPGPATEKPEQTHPMDAICGGRNRFSRGCRQY